MAFRLVSRLLVGCVIAGSATGCSDDAAEEGNGSATCDITISPGADDTKALQTAFVEATSGNTICLSPGNYTINELVTVGATPGLTIRGTGATPGDVMLDFAGQTQGDDGMLATGDDITIENFSVKNTRKNGIVVRGATGVVFRDVHVTWDRGPSTENGAYAIYPTNSEDVLIEGCEVYGASDAGVYLGQSKNAIVRRNKAWGNVIGIEVENTVGAEIYENEAYDNTVGIFVPLLPNLQQTVSEYTIVRNNKLYENNRANFGEANTVVSFLPPGLGMILLNADKVRVFDNEITDHDSSGIGIVGQAIMDEVTGSPADDPRTDGFPEDIYIHDNVIERFGAKPSGILATLGANPLEAIVWDGSERSPGSAKLCLGESPPSFRNFNGLDGVGDPSKHSTDASPYACTAAALDPITLP